MSEPMEDKRLERDDNKLGCGLCYIRDYSANCLIHGDEKRKEILMRAGADEFIQYHHNPIVDQKNKEIAALQSQITALNRELAAYKFSSDLDDATIESSEEVVLQQDKEIADLQDQLTTIKELLKELLNGASLHPETGVSLVDDVRDLVKEKEGYKETICKLGIDQQYLLDQIAGYKAQVAGQAKYIECLLDEIKQLKEDNLI